MKAGTLIELPDGRRGVVVYHGLDGYGVRLGKESLSEDELEAVVSGSGLQNIGIEGDKPNIFLEPNAMLRDAYPSANCECVGKDYEIIDQP